MSELIKIFEMTINNIISIFKKNKYLNEDSNIMETINNEKKELRNLFSKVPGAENFLYEEFVKSLVALRYGIKNVPNEEQWKAIEKVAVNIAQPLRNKFGRIRITSGFRSLELNRKIGSGDTSNHLRGEALDLEPLAKGVTLMQILTYVHSNLPHRELIAEFFPDGWVHVAYREGDNSKILKLKDENHNYSIVTLEYIKNIYG